MEVRPYWYLVAGLIVLYVFALMFVSWGPSRSSRRLGPGGTQQHLLGPGGTRQMFYEGFASTRANGTEGFASTRANGASGGLPFGGYTEGFADSSKPTFYMFGTEWCPHCVSAKPEFMKLTKTIGDRVNAVFVNPENDTSVAEENGLKIDGYPTFYLVQDGQKPKKYSGGRKHAEIEAWLRNELA